MFKDKTLDAEAEHQLYEQIMMPKVEKWAQ